MSLIVEDGTGLSTAESYLSVADCTTYNDAHNAVAAWTSANTAARERALRNATQYLEAEYNQRWRGSRLEDAQALAWPRTGVRLDGVCIEDGDIPRALLDATAELAVRAVAGELLADITTPGTIESERVKVGPLETEKTYMGGKSQTPEFRIVDRLLRGLVYDSDEVLRG